MYSPRYSPTILQGPCSPVCSPNSPMPAPTTAKRRMVKITRAEMIDAIDEVQWERDKVLLLEAEVACYGKEIAGYSSMLQDAMAIYFQATMTLDTILALTIIEPRLSGLHMSLMSEHDRQSMLRTVLPRLPDQVSKLRDRMLLVKGMADEYTAAIKAQLLCETETSDFDISIIDLPFWSELDRLWDLYFDVREEIDDYKRKANDVQPAILVIHLSLDEILSKLEIEREFMGNNEGFLNTHAQHRDCLVEWRQAQASEDTLATEESTPTSQSCTVVGSSTPAHVAPLQSAWSRQASLLKSRSSTPLNPASFNSAITPAIPAFAARPDSSNVAPGQSRGTHPGASPLTKPPRINTQERQQEQQATRLRESVSKTHGSTIPPDILLKIQKIASYEIISTLWHYLRTQRILFLGTGADKKSATTAPLGTVEDRINRLLSRYQAQYEAFLDDDIYFPEFHRRLYLSHIYSLYNQAKMTRRQNSRQRKRKRRTATDGRKAANRSLNDIFIDFLLPQLQKEDGTRQNAKKRFENWMALGRICAKLVVHFGEAILVLLPPDLSNEALRILTVRQEDAIITYLRELKPGLTSDIRNLTTFLSQVVEVKCPPLMKLKLEVLSKNEIESGGLARRSLKELFGLL